MTERYTNEAVKFIRANREQPFFLYFPHTAVHTPIAPGKAFQGRSSNGRFGDWVEEVDASVGRVLDTLRELQLADNTLVIFTSDNGPWLVKGPDGGSAGPLRGGKGSTWEGGVRVPTVAWWPGRVAAGKTCDAVAGTIDLLPTCVKFAGGVVPSEPVIDGRDMSGLLLGSSQASPRNAHSYFQGNGLQAVRKGKWKLAIASQASGMGKKNTQSPEPASLDQPRLYDLDADIGETTNVAASHPEVVASLKALAVAMQQELGNPQSPARRRAGSVANPQTIYQTVPQPPKQSQETKATKVSKQAEKAAAAARPNIVLFLADDLG